MEKSRFSHRLLLEGNGDCRSRPSCNHFLSRWLAQADAVGIHKE